MFLRTEVVAMLPKSSAGVSNTGSCLCCVVDFGDSVGLAVDSNRYAMLYCIGEHSIAKNVLPSKTSALQRHTQHTHKQSHT